MTPAGCLATGTHVGLRAGVAAGAWETLHGRRQGWEGNQRAGKGGTAERAIGACQAIQVFRLISQAGANYKTCFVEFRRPDRNRVIRGTGQSGVTRPGAIKPANSTRVSWDGMGLG